jgi:glycosyltransferase involved in cell wall biosynthesis
MQKHPKLMPTSNINSKQGKPSLLVGPTSRTVVTGLTLAFDLLLSGFDKNNISYFMTDLASFGAATRAGAFDLRRVMTTLTIWFSFLRKLRLVDSVYLLIASSRLGFLRNALMIWPSRLFRHRLVLHLHGGGYRHFYESQPSWFQRFIATTLAQADAIIVLGEALRDQFAFVPKHESKIRVVPNGLPLDLQPEIVVSKSLPKTGPFRLLYLSNLIESKGYLDVLAACRILHHDYQLPIRCDFCGTFRSTTLDRHRWSAKEAEAHFLSLIQEWQLTNIVTYHGVVRGETKQQLLEQAHTLLLPTSYPWEGQPLSILEALSFSTPVIATAHRGIPEQVKDKYNGFLVHPKAPKEIADAVKSMWQEPVFYDSLSQNARRHFLAHFTREKHLDSIIPIILGRQEHQIDKVSENGRASTIS